MAVWSCLLALRLFDVRKLSTPALFRNSEQSGFCEVVPMLLTARVTRRCSRLMNIFAMGLIATQLYHQNSSRLAFGCQSISGISAANALCFCYFRLSLCSLTNIILILFICCSFEKRAESLSFHLLDSSACPRHFLKHQHVKTCYNNFELLLEMLGSTVQINWKFFKSTGQ